MNRNEIWRFVAGAVCTLALCSCGGSEGTVPVGQSSSSPDITGTAATYRQSLSHAHIPIAASRCFEQDGSQTRHDWVQIPSFAAPRLYEFDVPASKANAAETLGFRRDFPHAGYFPMPVPCVTPEAIKDIGPTEPTTQ